VSADLDAICLRALRKEPARRYASVEQFSDDVHRYLRGLPVIARGDHLSYRAGKFLRRHRLELTAAVAVLLALVGSVVFSLREARLAEAQRLRAEKHFQSVRDLADIFMFKVHDAIAPLPGSVEARGLLVDTALRYLNTLTAEAGNDPTLQLELANAYIKVGDAQGEADGASEGKQREAVESYRKSAELTDHILATDPDNVGALRTLSASLRATSRVVLQLGGTQDALSASTRAVQVNEKLVKLDPGRTSEYQSARTHMSHSLTLDYAGHEQEAGEHIQLAVQMLEKLHDAKPDDLKIAADLASAYSILAATSFGPQRDERALAAAIVQHRKSAALDQLIFDRSPAAARDVKQLRAVFVSHANLANMLNLSGDFQEALTHCQAARGFIQQLRVDLKNAQTDVDDALIEAHCARTLRGLGRFDEAERTGRRNLAALDRLSGDGGNLHVQFQLGTVKELLGSVAEHRGDCGDAFDLYQGALEHFEKVTSAVTLDFIDLDAVEGAKAGMKRCEARR
jgi:tetratricopeptide (TPR) repeat protein